MTTIRWRCRRCSAAGLDYPGLVSFWAHFWAFHLPHSIYDGTGL